MFDKLNIHTPWVDKEKIKARLSSTQAWELPREPATLAPSNVASNKDQDPVPYEHRTWTAWHFSTYWMSDLINATTWQIASTGLLVGLSTTDAIIIAVLSGILNGIPTVLCGIPGSDHHIPFPILMRSTFGYWGSYFCVVSRAFLAIFWFGVNCYYGSFIVTEIIAAIWPSYRNITNTLPNSAQITTQQMLSYFLFCLVQFPFLLIPIEKLKKLFLVKAILLIPVSVGMVIWICVKAGDVQGIFGQPAIVSGSTRTWLWIGTLSANTNSWLPNSLNMSDFTRYSKTKNAPYSMLPTIPIVRTIYAILGITMTGAGRVLYNEDLWSPTLLLSKWTGSGGRFMAFLCGCLWLLAQISTNVSANSAPFAHDLMSLAPGWINIRRGSVLGMLLGAWALVPWSVVNSATKFLSFMGGYGCFIAIFVGTMLSDYFFVRRRKLDVPGLYNPHGRYRYKAGVNWRAFATFVLFGSISFPGLVNSIRPDIEIPDGFQRIYELNFLINIFGPAFMYWALSVMFPDRESTAVNQESSTLVGVPDGDESVLGSDGAKNKTGIVSTVDAGLAKRSSSPQIVDQ